MSKAAFKVVHIDDEEVVREQVRELLEGDGSLGLLGGVQVESFSSFKDGLNHLVEQGADIVILDVMDGHGVSDAEPEAEGRTTFEAIRESVFIPVIFFTGFGTQVGDLAGEFKLIRVVDKGKVDPLIESVAEVIEQGLPGINQALFGLLREVQRAYMWDFVATHWPAYRDHGDPVALAHLLLRRFARFLASSGPEKLAQAIGAGSGEGPGQSSGAEGRIHPMLMYVMPPLEDAKPLAGDIRMAPAGSSGGGDHWIVLTPSCDFAQGKADEVLLARCDLLAGQPEFEAYQEAHQDSKRKKLERLLRNNGEGRQTDRFYFLPGALDLPDLLVDLRAVKVVTRAAFDDLIAVVSLDAPFAEALLNQFARYSSRLGTPDLDVDFVLDRLAELGTTGSA